MTFRFGYGITMSVMFEVSSSNGFDIDSKECEVVRKSVADRFFYYLDLKEKEDEETVSNFNLDLHDFLDSLR